jgi:predicted GNAT family acetyltransferase
MYRLDSVTLLEAPPGRWRPAGSPDRDLLVEWSEAFEIEAETPMAETAARNVDRRLAEDRAFVWVDDVPVSYAGTTMPLGGVVRIGPVYTPPRHRKRGYASALVAAASQHALNSGAVACSLYTDLANPTSNKIYQAVGYHPICDVTMYQFTTNEA